MSRLERNVKIHLFDGFVTTQQRNKRSITSKTLQ